MAAGANRADQIVEAVERRVALAKTPEATAAAKVSSS
jgi:hypothetical protein